MKNIFSNKMVVLSTTIMFLLFSTPRLESAEIAIKIPFGHGSQPKSRNIIDSLRDEETKGAGAAIGLIALGACIVVAAVVITNKADDIKEDVEEKYDEEKDTFSSK